jgi:hypothetical protein
MTLSRILAGTFWVGTRLLAGGLLLLGCVVPSSSSTDAGPPGDADLGAKSTGTGCGSDGVTLCVSTSECPNVSVNQDTFPECGFYITSSGTFLACLCSNYLCSIGQPTSCVEAASMLAATNEGTVCGQVSNDTCTAVALSSTDAGTTTTDAGAADSGCNASCELMCGSDPDCIQLCGC